MSDSIRRLNSALSGRYRVERELGVGGMATVYRARDLRHERNVALKVLKPELAAVVGAHRFLAEIRTTANLQHPHILPLFDSGEADSLIFYVMPFVGGESLRERLDRDGQLPVDEAVQIAVALASALGYAHRQGVVHRDIKPANVLIHDGQPIISDFGIALALGTDATRLTETGISLGTPHYMSPEQATGDGTVGPATDVYALACVLYEMLVGEPPFTGSTPQAILGKIVTRPADPVRLHRRSVPANVEAAIRRALEKVPADRFGSAAEFAAALRDRTFVHAADYEARPVGHVGAPTRKSLTALLASLALGAVGLAAWGWLRPVPMIPVVRYEASFPRGESRDGELFSATVALSPDGGSLVFRSPPSGAGQLYIKRREDLTEQPLSGTEGGIGPFFSPDGQWIGFFAEGEMRRIPASGGTSVLITDSITATYAGGAWLEDGSIVYYSLPAIRRVSAAGGPSEIIASPASLGGLLPWLPTPLPASRGALFTACGNSGPSTCNPSQVYVYDAMRDTVRLTFEDALGAWHVPTGHVLYLSSTGTLYAVAWNNDELLPEGPPVPVLDGVQAPGLVLSAEGTMLYVMGPPLYESPYAPNSEAVWVDRAGEVELVDPAWRFNLGSGNADVALSPDGSRAAIPLRTDLGLDVWLKTLPTGPVSRLTFFDGVDRAPAWSPDGRAVTFLSNRPTPSGAAADRLNLWQQSADGTDEPRLLSAERGLAKAFMSPDGQWLMLGTAPAPGDGGSADILAVRVGSAAAARPIVASAFDERSPALSPDSRWLAYVSNETGIDEVYIRPFPEVDRGKWQASAGGASAPTWARSGRELFYVARGVMNAVEIDPGPPVTIGQASFLFVVPEKVRAGGQSFGGTFAVTPDDQRFLMIRTTTPWDADAPPRLVMVQNFFEELRLASPR